MLSYPNASTDFLPLSDFQLSPTVSFMIPIPSLLILKTRTPATDIEDDASSYIADHQDDLQSHHSDVPPHVEDHSRPIPVPIFTDLPGKRPRDDTST